MRYPKRSVRLTALFAGLAMVALACGSSNSGGGGGSGGGTGSSSDLSGASFTVGSKEFTEQLVLGQITKLVLENAGATVNDKTGITGTTNVRKSLTSGQIDMYWEYTGTGYAEILGNDVSKAPTDQQQLFDAVAKEDLAKNNIEWIDLAPMNDTYAIATAGGSDVTTLSQYADLVNSNPSDGSMCAAAEFLDRADGFPGLEKAYGFQLPDSALTEVDLGIIFTRVPKGDPCKFGEVFATDGRIPANNMMVLEDDKNFFVKYNVALTVRKEVLDKYPQIKDLFAPIAAKLDTETMQKLNSQVDVDGLPPEAVAQQWLQDNGFLG